MSGAARAGRRGGRARSLARSAARLLPHSLLFSAIFQKEMRVSGRKNSTFLTRSIYTLVAVAICLLVFLAVRSEPGPGATDSPAATIQGMQQIAPAVTFAVLWFQMIALPLVACMLTGPSVCEEVRNRSLPALLTTPLSAPQIIFSKLAGAIVHVAILSLVTLPILLGLRIFGGADAATAIGGTALTLSMAILAGSVGMLVSVMSKRAAMAGSGAIAFTFALLFLPIPIMFLLAARGVLFTQATAMQTMLTTNAPVTLMAVFSLAQGMGGPPGAGSPMQLITANVAYNLGMSLVLLSAASVLFRRRLTGDRAESAGAAATGPRARRARRRSAAPVAAAVPEAGGVPGAEVATAAPPMPPVTEPVADTAIEVVEHESRTVGDRPVLWRELRRQGPRASARRMGLWTALLVIGMLATLGLALPIWGMVDFYRTALGNRSSGALQTSYPLAIITVVFCVAVLALLGRTAWMTLRGFSSGRPIISPPRPLLMGTMVFGVLVLAYWGMEGDYTGLHQTISVIGPALVFLRAATANAGTLSEEREARTWETLLTTRLSPREILLGKLAGALSRQWDIPALVLLHFIVCGCLLDGLPVSLLVHMAAIMGTGVAFLSGTGMLFAMLTTKGTGAALANLGLALGVWLGLPLLLGVLGGILGSGDPWFLRLTIMTQPVPLGVFAVAGATDTYSGQPSYNILGWELGELGFTLYVLGVAAGYIAVGAAAVMAACSMFNARTGRTS